ncbi:hypothetical protein Hanom_Chr17g01565791 [Helianthus anomalus]
MSEQWDHGALTCRFMWRKKLVSAPRLNFVFVKRCLLTLPSNADKPIWKVIYEDAPGMMVVRKLLPNAQCWYDPISCIHGGNYWLRRTLKVKVHRFRTLAL